MGDELLKTLGVGVAAQAKVVRIMETSHGDTEAQRK